MAPESGNDDDAELAGSQGARDRPKRIGRPTTELKQGAIGPSGCGVCGGRVPPLTMRQPAPRDHEGQPGHGKGPNQAEQKRQQDSPGRDEGQGEGDGGDQGSHDLDGLDTHGRLNAACRPRLQNAAI